MNGDTNIILPPPPTPPIQKPPELVAPKPPSIRTMVGDTERALKSGEVSGASVLTRGGASARGGAYADEPAGWRTRRLALWAGVGVVLVALASASVFFWLATQRGPSAPVVTAPAPAIPASQTDIIQLRTNDRAAFLAEWNTLYQQPLLPGEFHRIVALDAGTQTFLSAEAWLSALDIGAPALLTAGLRDVPTAGVLRTGRGRETVLILRARSFSEALGGMLAWERDLPRALSPLLAPDVSQERGTGAFSDVVIANHDVRLLKNTTGDPILLYTIFNRELLIIAQSPEALEIVLRQLSFFPSS